MNKTMLYQVRRARKLYLNSSGYMIFICLALKGKTNVELVIELIHKLIQEKGGYVLFEYKRCGSYSHIPPRIEWFNTLIHFYSQEH